MNGNDEVLVINDSLAERMMQGPLPKVLVGDEKEMGVLPGVVLGSWICDPFRVAEQSYDSVMSSISKALKEMSCRVVFSINNAEILGTRELKKGAKLCVTATVQANLIDDVGKVIFSTQGIDTGYYSMNDGVSKALQRARFFALKNLLGLYEHTEGCDEKAV